MMYGYGISQGFSLIGGIFSLVFWVLLIWLIVAIVRGASGHHHGGGCWGSGCWEDKEKTDSAMDILRERYAKGEISKEEFEEKSQVLKTK